MAVKLTMENNTLNEIIKLVELQKKAQQQIFTLADLEALNRGAVQFYPSIRIGISILQQSIRKITKG